MSGLGVAIFFFVVVLVIIAKTAIVVPQQNAYIVERLGKFHRRLDAGFHILIPFLDRISYRHNLKEEALDIPEQTCITSDNVTVQVDGVLYMQVVDPARASYGISDYVSAIIQLAQTTLRSEFGKLVLDRTFEERTHVNARVVHAVDEASGTWGVKVLRYEIKNITPPRDVLDAMEKQMRAEREKRAAILKSEGERDSAINVAEGHKARVIKESEAAMQRQVNEAKGQAEAILAVASATADGLKRVSESVSGPGGGAAMQLRIAEQFVGEFGKLAKAGNTFVIPANLSDVGSMIAMASALFKGNLDGDDRALPRAKS